MTQLGNKICQMRPGHSVVVRDGAGGFTFRYESFREHDAGAVVSFKGARVVMFEGDSVDVDETKITYVRCVGGMEVSYIRNGEEVSRILDDDEIKFSFRAPPSVRIGDVPRRPGPAEVKA